jgi:phosphatidylserine/phosphatidylglycerophosphate/cardiolipin synthase-like enzyme
MLLAALFAGAILSPRPAAASDTLCDPSFEDCRAPLLELIRNEQVAIDVAFWFMEDPRYTAELQRAYERGVQVRVLVDTRANSPNPLNASRLAELEAVLSAEKSSDARRTTPSPGRAFDSTATHRSAISNSPQSATAGGELVLRRGAGYA